MKLLKWNGAPSAITGTVVGGVLASIAMVVPAVSPGAAPIAHALPGTIIASDDFQPEGYSGGSGWADNDDGNTGWDEDGDNDSAAPGTISIRDTGAGNFALEFRSPGDDSIERFVDLSSDVGSENVYVRFDLLSEHGGVEALAVQLNTASGWEDYDDLADTRSNPGNDQPPLPYTATIQLAADQIGSFSGIRFTLPQTGIDATSAMLQIGGLLFAIGVVVVLIARRRRDWPMPG